jgi:hypothetical protein
MLRFLFAVSAALVAIGTVLPAQPVWPRGTARVAGMVLDSATGRPIIRTRICREVDLNPPYGRGVLCASPDSTGRYVLDSLPDGRQVVTADCSGERILGGRRLRLDTLEVGSGMEARLDVSTSAAGCDMRPFTTRRGLFRGQYVTGFEESSFRACGDSVSAWVRFVGSATDSRAEWPKPNDKYYPSFYVEWEGTLRGPWHYGHMGVARYEMEVERVRIVRRPSRSDCR